MQAEPEARVAPLMFALPPLFLNPPGPPPGPELESPSPEPP